MTSSPAVPVTHHRTATIDGVEHLLPRGRAGRRTGGPAAARLSHLLAHVPQPDPGAGRQLPGDRPGLSGLRPERHAGPGRASPTPSTASPSSWTACSTSWGSTRFAMYVMDYGAPVGWRLALKHPGQVTGLIVQNGNAYEEGLTAFWDPIKAYWADGSDDQRQALRVLVTPEITKFQYTDGVADVSRISPDNWVHDQALLDRPGNAEIQLDMFYDYRTNLPLYPAIQAWFRERQPPTLLVWGAERQDLPGRRCASLQARPSRDRVPPHRHRPLRAGGQGRRDRTADPRLPRPQDRRLSRRGRPSWPSNARLCRHSRKRAQERRCAGPRTPGTRATRCRWHPPTRSTASWRNRAEFLHGRDAIVAFLTRKWQRELDYRLIKEAVGVHAGTGSPCASPMSGTTTAAPGSAATATRTGSSTRTA